MAFDKLRLSNHALEPADRRVESFQVSNLKNHILRFRRGDQLARFGDVRRQRLFDQNIDAGFDQLARHLKMKARRHSDADALDPTEQAAIIGKHFGAERCADLTRAFFVAVDHRDEIRLGRSGILLGVEFAEVADADHGGRCDAFCHRAIYSSALTPTTAIP